MTKDMVIGGITFKLVVERKFVKNINLHIKADGSLYVSAHPLVDMTVIDSFIRSKSDFIIKAYGKLNAKQTAPRTEYFEEEELKAFIISFCKKVYPYYEKKGIGFPEIKFKNMVSRWGSCHPVKGILVFNTKLRYAPKECVEYVVWHEFTHFLQANHSARFYKELELVCPLWKERRSILKGISVKEND